MANTFTLTEAAAKYGVDYVAPYMDYSQLLQGIAGSTVTQSLSTATIRTDFTSGFHLDTVGFVSGPASFNFLSISLYSPSSELLMRCDSDGSMPILGGGTAPFDTMRGPVTLLGNSANNVFHVSADTTGCVINGGAGFDVVDLRGMKTYAGTNIEGAAVQGFAGDGGYVLSTYAHNYTNFDLTNVERVVGDDWAYAYDLQGNGGEAYRLYQAAFDRKPDLPGLGFQIDALDSGLTLTQVAGNFIASPEFQRTYGQVDDQEFITLLYQNVLHRAPEAEGFQYHLDEFAQGQSRADMLTHFSESPENQANLIGDIQFGILYTPLHA